MRRTRLRRPVLRGSGAAAAREGGSETPASRGRAERGGATRTPDLASLESHYEFGRNWESFAGLVDPERRARASASLLRFLPPGELFDARFLDLGCGSGLFSLAALDLGASRVLAVDIDPVAVETARRLLAVSAKGGGWACRRASVFALDPGTTGRFDVVYSWGVLHHTGDLRRALRHAGGLVEPGGLLFLALYRKTLLCPFWRWEKRRYARASAGARRAVRGLYKAAFAASLLATGRSPGRYFAGYRERRGMDWGHDVEDWLGGYPYESIAPSEVRAILHARGFREVKSETRPGGIGLMGSGCDEYLFRRAPSGGEGEG